MKPPLVWALQDEALAAAVDAVVAAEASAPALAERLARTHRDGLGMTPEASAAHLQALRSGTAAGSTRAEREYASLFETVRTARSRLLAAVSRRDFAVAPRRRICGRGEAFPWPASLRC